MGDAPRIQELFHIEFFSFFGNFYFVTMELLKKKVKQMLNFYTQK